ncbi:MAG TPA: altronate dehydratase family protein, partial [Bryobacteraceae bacterium]
MSLLRIQTATPETAAIRLNPADNVAIARVPLSRGQQVRICAEDISVAEPIPVGHKVAIQAIRAGGAVIRYGAFIGKASRDIARGAHVHSHNLAFEGVPVREEMPEHEIAPAVYPRGIPVFLGYSRPDGRAGTRNYIAIAAASNCAAHTVELIAASFASGELPDGIDGVVAFPHGEGCGHSAGPDTRQLHRVIAGVLDHPNVGAGLLVGLGCEVNQVSEYFPDSSLRSGLFTGMTLQSSGGTNATVEAGVREVKRLIESLVASGGAARVPVPASKIVLGLNCGGSDSFSGISANPALGVCSDMLAAIGATSVLAETTEIFGAEHLLLRRARNRAVAEKLLEYVHAYHRYLRQFGGSVDDNPSPGNKQGGLTNIAEKSLGAVAKSGTSPLMAVFDYAERIDTAGFVFMNTPGYDPVSLTGLAAGGVNLIAFTTGRGSAIGFPTVPVFKISTNTATFENMRDNIDLNAGRIMDGETTVEQVGREIFAELLKVASGRRTASEILGHREFV